MTDDGPRPAPRRDDRCGWWTILPDPPDLRRPAASIDADYLVIGAGYTGLAAARRLAELDPRGSVVIVDALRVGQGSAGRNSGFVVDVGHGVPALGVEGNRGLVTLARAGLDTLRAQVHAHAIDCDWQEDGRLHVAASPRGRRKLDAFARGLEAMGETYEVLDESARQTATGTDYYTHALRLPGGALVQPAALVRGLAATLPEPVQLYEQQRVLTIDPGSPHVVRCTDTTIRAAHLVLATNAFTPGLGALRGRVIPLVTYASLTAPLPDADRPGAAPWGLVPEEPLGSTLRRTIDGRLLVRNTVAYHPHDPLGDASLARARDHHQASLRARFPALSGVSLQSTWGGVLGMTLNATHALAKPHDTMVVAAAFNGVGIAMGTAFGTLAAEFLRGHDSDRLQTALSLPRPTWLPGDPLRRLGLGVYVGALQWLAGGER